MEPYAATKFAVVAISEGWRVQLAPKGIGVSVLCPGFVRTNIGTGHRNRPGGPRGNSGGQASVLNQLVEGGMDPRMLAARVLEGIRDDELYISRIRSSRARLRRGSTPSSRRSTGPPRARHSRD